MAKAQPVDPAPDEQLADAPAPVVAPEPPAIPVVAQPTEPVGLPTGNPWDLAYPLGHLPPSVKGDGDQQKNDTSDLGAGYVGVQAAEIPNGDLDALSPSPSSEES